MNNFINAMSKRDLKVEWAIYLDEYVLSHDMMDELEDFMKVEGQEVQVYQGNSGPVIKFSDKDRADAIWRIFQRWIKINEMDLV